MTHKEHINSPVLTVSDAEKIFTAVKDKFSIKGMPASFLSSANHALPLEIMLHYPSSTIGSLTSPAGVFFVNVKNGHEIGVMSIDKHLSDSDQSFESMVEEYIHYLHVANNPFLRSNFINRLTEVEKKSTIQSNQAAEYEIQHMLGLEEDVFQVLDSYINALADSCPEVETKQRTGQNVILNSFHHSNITQAEALKIAQELSIYLGGSGEYYGYLGTGEEMSLSERLEQIRQGQDTNNCLSKSIWYGLVYDISASINYHKLTYEYLSQLLNRYKIPLADFLGSYQTHYEVVHGLSLENQLKYLTKLLENQLPQSIICEIASYLYNFTSKADTVHKQPFSKMNAKAQLLQMIREIIEQSRTIDSKIGNSRWSINTVIAGAINSALCKEVKLAEGKSLVLQQVALNRTEWSTQQAIANLANVSLRDTFIREVKSNPAYFFPEGISIESFLTEEGWRRTQQYLTDNYLTLDREDYDFLNNLLSLTWNQSIGITGGEVSRTIYRSRDIRINASLVDAYELQSTRTFVDMAKSQSNILLEPIAKILKHRIIKGTAARAIDIEQELAVYDGFFLLIKNRANTDWINQMIQFVEKIFNSNRFDLLSAFFKCKNFKEQLALIRKEI